jgi:ribose-phosphate pyrophosphokinase
MVIKESLKLFSGSSNPALARAMADLLDAELDPIRIERFSDGEMFTEIGTNVRGADVFVMQSTSSPCNENIMELLIIIDALKRASAKSICAVIPYYGYARQDRKVQPRTPITAKLVADLLDVAGATRVLSVDLHAGQIQGFFNMPFDHLFATPIMLEDLRERRDLDQCVIVSPDAGGLERARAWAKRVGLGLAIIDKRRSRANVAEVMHIIGEVKGKHAILIDDMVDTAGTLCEAAHALMDAGVTGVSGYATHAVLSGPALQRISESPLDRVVFSDSIRLSPQAAQCSKIEVRSIAPLLAKAIRRIFLGESVSSLFV